MGISKVNIIVPYSANDKGTTGNYAIQHGTPAAIKYFKLQYLSLQ